MLGELLGENTGKRIVRRVLGTNPLTAEVSFEETGTMLGVATSGFGTYTSVVRPDGSIYGEGQGGLFTSDGEGVTGKARGWENSDRAAPSAIVGFSIFRPHHRSWRG